MWCKQETTTWSDPDIIVAAHERCLGRTPEQMEEELDAWRMEHGFAYAVKGFRAASSIGRAFDS
jgi:hypothetical protein